VRHAPPGSLHPASAGRVRDAHQVGGPPEEVFQLDEMVILHGFHGIAGEHFVAAKVNQLTQHLASRGNYCRSGSSPSALAWNCAMLCVANSCIPIPVSSQSRATYQRTSASLSLTSLLCSGVRRNLPVANATASSDPILPASSCNPKTGSSTDHDYFARRRVL